MKTFKEAKREAIAQAFKEAHSYDLDAWPDTLNDIYWKLINGMYGEIERCNMGEGVINYTVEISGTQSKSGIPIIFDIDICSYLLDDIELITLKKAVATAKQYIINEGV